MSEKEQTAERIIRQLRGKGFQAYLVGGSVRDLVMGVSPRDYDIATDALPEEVGRIFPETIPVGIQFGVQLVIEQGNQHEVATFRSDHRYRDGRHPTEVRFTKSPSEDVERRDFTVNGLLYDPLGGKVLDFIGGKKDIERCVIRTIGDAETRFGEDHLRLMRAVRFASRLDFSIDPETFAAIRKLAPSIQSVSAERVRDEILKILTEGGARRGFELLDETGLLHEVLPEVEKMKGVEQPPQFHPEGDVWVHTLMMLAQLESPTPTLALGVLLHDVGKPPTFTVSDRIRFNNHADVGTRMAEEICGRLRVPTRVTERVSELVRHHLRFKDFPQMRPAKQKRFLRMDGFEEHLELHRLDCISSHGNLANYELARKMLAETPAEEIRPTPLITGRDLIEQGYEPGPRFKEILSAVEDAQLEGTLNSQPNALRFIQERFPDRG